MLVVFKILNAMGNLEDFLFSCVLIPFITLVFGDISLLFTRFEGAECT
jgi:hypothetical protein